MKVSPLTLDMSINPSFIATVVAALLFQSAINAKSETRINNIEAATKDVPQMSADIAVLKERSESTKATLARIEQQTAVR